MEAGLAGVPVIATSHAGIADVVLHGETGLLSEEHNVDAMAKHMVQLLDDPSLVKKMGANNRERIKEHFSLEKHIGILQVAINKTVSSNNS